MEPLKKLKLKKKNKFHWDNDLRSSFELLWMVLHETTAGVDDEKGVRELRWIH